MALATRCPHCETVFKLDPHLLAPHDGRVRCGHCQEVFDAAHHRFELPGEPGAPGETQHAAIIDDDVAVGPSFSASTSETSASDKPATPLTPAPRTLEVAKPQPARPVPPPSDLPPRITTPLPASRDDDSERTLYAGTPAHTEAANEAGEHARVKQFVRVSPAPTDEARPVHVKTVAPIAPVAPVAPLAPSTHGDDRAEPFIGPVPREQAPPQVRPAPQPWPDDPEPGFGAKAPGGTHSASANEAFPVARSEAREPREFRDQPNVYGAQDSGRMRKILHFGGIVLAVLLGLVLVLQIAWWQRETVMVLMPSTHSLYSDACDSLGCNISPPRDIDGLQIETSGLRQVDGPHKLELKLSLRNRLDIALAYPALELTLLDDKNNVAIRRVLWPQDYARPGTIFAIGLPPQSAQPVVVRLDTGDAVAANYRVQVFYP
jgi:predicted Zn finger-like uncharacterized protein